MKLSLILAVGDGGLIGKNDGLPWENIPADMERFKKLTINKTVVMGRKTWESLPAKYRPLPNRQNVVLTRDKNYNADGAKVLFSVSALCAYLKGNKEETFIIGGAKLVKRLYKYINKAYMTNVHGDYSGDVYLDSEIDAELFLFSDTWEIKSQKYIPGDDHVPSVDFVDLVRIST